MNAPSHPARIRRFEPGDEPAVTEICYQTGYMGESAAGRFGDRKLFAMLFAQAYPRFSPGTCFVACVDSRAVGYCFAVADSQEFGEWFAKHQRPFIVRHAALRTIWRSPGDVLRVVRWDRRPKADWRAIRAEYPAHFHVNVLPGYQRRGIGSRLLAAAMEALTQQRAGAVHLQTSSRNVAAINLYRRLGLTCILVDDRNLWGVDGVQSIVMGMTLPKGDL